MNNMIQVARFAVTLALTALFGCAMAPAGTAEDTEQTAEALSGSSGHVRYYSDATYTTLVGGKTYTCNGGSSSWGTKTRYAAGEFESCTDDWSYGCYEWVDGALTCYDDTCVNC
jgi:hypothetical protein